ncbi:MAG: hypothetical protein FJ308_14165 [Planctomycetes bacterium]|nr:hypothetical protein [Planctomycetota bacterium]
MRTRILTALMVSLSTGLAWAQESLVDTQLPKTIGLELVPAQTALSPQGNELSQNQWVRITTSGAIRGSVVAVSGDVHVKQPKMSVALVSEDQVVATDETDVDGDFIIEKGKPGVYSIVVRGQGQLAVYSLTVLDAETGAHLPERIEVRTIAPASPRIAELIRSNTIPIVLEGNRIANDPLGDKRAFQDSYEVVIDERSGICGTLSRPNANVDLSQTLVYLTVEGREVMRTRAASNGTYRFEGVEPGSYGLVASGPQGIAALGFCAIDGKDEKAVSGLDNSKGAMFVGIRSRHACRRLNVELADPNCYAPAEIVVAEECVEEVACAPMMGCGSGYQGGGGGGGGGGIGAGGNGLFGLAALGGLIGVGIAAATNDNNNSTVSAVAP